MKNLSNAHNIEDLRRIAKSRLPKGLFDFIDGGVEDGIGLRNNRAAFDRINLFQRAFVDLESRQSGISMFGNDWKMPFAIAPTGIVGLVWHKGEIAAARAAARAGVPYALSTASITPLEEVARNVDGELWFQLYVWEDLSLTFELVERARQAGYHALVVTVDTAAGTNREYNKRNRFEVPFRVTPRATWHVMQKPGWALSVMARSLMSGGVPRFANLPEAMQIDLRGKRKGGQHVSRSPAVSPELLRRLRDKWKGPLLVKGILHPDDARVAVDCGADAIVVSNHGGRVLDGALPSIDALPAIASAVGDRASVLLDSGVRRGSDVAKALALGADAVLVGRAPIWGTAVAGEAGASHALAILKEETMRVMGQVGCLRPMDLDRTCLAGPDIPGDGALVGEGDRNIGADRQGMNAEQAALASI